MRDILFRGKRIDINEWTEGYYAVSPTDSKSYIYAKDYHEMDIAEDGLHVAYRLMQVFPNTVGQYTNLTDKNDKKIFEWDIIKVPDCCHRGDAVGFVYYDCNETAYCAKCWGIKYQLGADLSSDSIEIIGNIHDNPELLEV